MHEFSTLRFILEVPSLVHIYLWKPAQAHPKWFWARCHILFMHEFSTLRRCILEVATLVHICLLKPMQVHSNLSYRLPPNSDHLSTATTIFNFYNRKLPPNIGHLSTITHLGSLCIGLIVHPKFNLMWNKNRMWQHGFWALMLTTTTDRPPPYDFFCNHVT